MLHHTSIADSLSRRELLRSGCGFAYLALAGMAAKTNAAEIPNGLTSKLPHHPPRAKRVIMLYMEGGPSQLDTLEYKPALKQLAGKRVELGEDSFRFHGGLMPSHWRFRPNPKTGVYFSDLLPHLRSVSEELCLLSGMHTDSAAHAPATMMFHTGAFRFVRPSMGSWVVYGLGSDNENLPAFVTINPIDHLGGPQNYGSSFLPASYQATKITTKEDAIPHLANSFETTERQRQFLNLVQSQNRDYLQRRRSSPEVEALIHTYELAFQMQADLPEAMDIQHESAHTKRLYGITSDDKNLFSVQCLMARRLAEAGVRFIQLTSRGWDHHAALAQGLSGRCRDVDRAIAGLILDLKQRGMLDETLIVWGGEFGRSAAEQNSGDGRRHQSLGYTMFLAGGGVQGGIRYGATDETGSRAVEGRVHIHDLHATILHLLGLDHRRLTFRFSGRDFRLTDVYGRVVAPILA